MAGPCCRLRATMQPPSIRGPSAPSLSDSLSDSLVAAGCGPQCSPPQWLPCGSLMPCLWLQVGGPNAVLLSDEHLVQSIQALASCGIPCTGPQQEKVCGTSVCCTLWGGRPPLEEAAYVHVYAYHATVPCMMALAEKLSEV
eukprot:1161921-Pelagomonas_calceolata.AAC.26